MRFSHVDAHKKLLAALAFALCTTVLTNIWASAVAFLLAFFLILCSGISFLYWLKALIPVLVFCLFLWITMPISLAFTSNADFFSKEVFSFLAQGAILSGNITLKACAITSALLALAGTSSISANGRALLKLHVPRKLVTLLLITHANNLLFYREFQNIWAAAKLRGFYPRNTLATYKTCAWMAGLLLLRAWRKAQRRENAMALRGFCGLYPLLDAGNLTKSAFSFAEFFMWLICLMTFTLFLLTCAQG